ncbi:MAG: metal-sensing transcriptional repressor [Oligoflexia bacterium]|nr:metal-sensing transcriptional repressor [Oligoflexia bacterium]
MKRKNATMNERRKKTLVHIKRIQGQLNTLVNYIEDGQNCKDIAMLTTSIAKSFDALRFRTLEGYIINDLLVGTKTSIEQIETWGSRSSPQ